MWAYRRESGRSRRSGVSGLVDGRFRARTGCGGRVGTRRYRVFSLAVTRGGLNVAGRPALVLLNAGRFLSRIYGQYSVGGRAVGG